MNHWKNIWIRLLILAVLLGVPGIPSSADAATKRVRARTDYTLAPRLQLGKNRVKQTANDSYVGFTAPVGGIYRMTVYSLKTLPIIKKDINYGLLFFKRMRGGELKPRTTITQGGKSDCLYLTTAYSYRKFYKHKKVTLKQYRSKRTARLPIDRKQTIYLQLYYTTKSGNCVYYIDVEKL